VTLARCDRDSCTGRSSIRLAPCCRQSVRHAVTRKQTINGRRLNEDTYTVQIIDEQERLVSSRSRPPEFRRPQTTPSPHTDKFSAQELADLEAYSFPERCEMITHGVHPSYASALLILSPAAHNA